MAATPAATAAAAGSNAGLHSATPSGIFAAGLSHANIITNFKKISQEELNLIYTYTHINNITEHSSSNIYEDRPGYTVTLAIIYNNKKNTFPANIDKISLHGVLGWPVTDAQLKELSTTYNDLVPDNLRVPSKQTNNVNTKKAANENFRKWMCGLEFTVKAVVPKAAAGSNATLGTTGPAQPNFIVSSKKFDNQNYELMSRDLFNPINSDKINQALKNEYNRNNGFDIKEPATTEGGGGYLRGENFALNIEETRGNKDVVYDILASNGEGIPNGNKYVIKLPQKLPQNKKKLTIIAENMKFITADVTINEQQDPLGHFLNAPCLFILKTTKDAILRDNSNAAAATTAAAVKGNYAVGYYSGMYKNWRRVTSAEWTNPEFQAALVQAHQAGSGWPLLEEPLKCTGILYVAEGCVYINGKAIIEVAGKNSRELLNTHNILNNKYSAILYNRNDPSIRISFNDYLLNKTDKWTIGQNKATNTYNPPCLFIREAVIGGRRTHRKHSKNHLKKHKKTRIRRHL